MKIGFKLVRSKTYPPKPMPGCPKCGQKEPRRGVIWAEGRLLGFTIRYYDGPAGLKTYSVLKGNKRLFDGSFMGHLTVGGTAGSFTKAELQRLRSIPRSKQADTYPNLDTVRRVKGAERWVTPGADLTGDGRPNLIVHEYSGSRACCHTIDILELKPRVRRVQTIAFKYGEFWDAHFVDLDNDGFPEIDHQDWTFANWKSAFHSVIGPRVVLKYRRKRFRIDTSLMRSRAPNVTNLRDEAKRLSKAGGFSENTAPYMVWTRMLKLVYTGHAQLARRFYDMVWPKGVKGKRRFLNVFRKRLRTSPYWSAVRKMDGAI